MTPSDAEAAERAHSGPSIMAVSYVLDDLPRTYQLMKIGLETHNRRRTSLLPVLLLAIAIVVGVAQAGCGGEKELKRDFSALNPERCADGFENCGAGLSQPTAASKP